MAKELTVDPQKCVACRTCENICSLVKTGKCNPRNGRIQVETFDEEGFYCPTICFQCREAWCAQSCPAAAIERDEATGALVVNEDRCVGCRMCTMVCPFAQVSVSKETGKSNKCDLCGGDPMCVKTCPTQAIQYEKIDRSQMDRRKSMARKVMIASQTETD
jgi:anaerobic carbon-monoxide dehydrogenase iron sulfur subunit